MFSKILRDMNYSPFLPHHNVPIYHPPRLMDGVRRWIRSGSPLRHASIRAEPHADPNASSDSDAERVDKTSTEYIAAALLNPVVTAKEKKEYWDYVTQCEEMLDSQDMDCVEAKDQQLYANVVAVAAMGPVEEDAQVWPTPTEKDIDIYYGYVEKANPFDDEVVGGKEFLPVAFNYEKWTTEDYCD